MFNFFFPSFEHLLDLNDYLPIQLFLNYSKFNFFFLSFESLLVFNVYLPIQ